MISLPLPLTETTLLRPEDPVDLNFVVDPNFIPAGFLKSDITHHGRRHLLFATDRERRTLKMDFKLYLHVSLIACL